MPCNDITGCWIELRFFFPERARELRIRIYFLYPQLIAQLIILKYFVAIVGKSFVATSQSSSSQYQCIEERVLTQILFRGILADSDLHH